MLPQFAKLVLPVGHVTQQRIGDCLVACAGMLLTYAGKPFYYRQVLRQLKTNDFGTVFSNIRRLAVPGATVQVSRGDIDRLYQLYNGINHVLWLSVPQSYPIGTTIHPMGKRWLMLSLL